VFNNWGGAVVNINGVGWGVAVNISVVSWGVGVAAVRNWGNVVVTVGGVGGFNSVVRCLQDSLTFVVDDWGGRVVDVNTWGVVIGCGIVLGGDIAAGVMSVDWGVGFNDFVVIGGGGSVVDMVRSGRFNDFVVRDGRGILDVVSGWGVAIGGGVVSDGG
jgi:hypothetical protein